MGTANFDDTQQQQQMDTFCMHRYKVKFFVRSFVLRGHNTTREAEDGAKKKKNLVGICVKWSSLIYPSSGRN